MDFSFQSLFLTLSLIPVIKYAKYCFSNKPNVGFWSIWVAFILYTPFRNSSASDIHAEFLILPFFSFIAYLLLTKRFKLASILSLFLVLFKENFIVYHFGMGLYLLFKKQYKKTVYLILLALFLLFL